MSEASSSPKRPRLDYDDNSEKEDRYEKYKNRDRDHDEQSFLPSKNRKRSEQDEDDLKEEESKSKTLNLETARREHTLVMRLTSKEQELQDCMNQIQEMKQAQTQNTAQLRSMLLDPAINLVFQRMAKEMDEHREKLKQKQNELSAWKFTPDSQTGMRLMAKCRMLLAENGELGKMISSGRTARLEGEIVLHKALVTEMKKNQKELDEFLRELDVDVEGMQGMILLLQQQLKDAREQISRLQQENDQLRTLRPPDSEVGQIKMEISSPAPVKNWPSEVESSNEEIDSSNVHVSAVNSGSSTWSDHGTNKSAPTAVSCLSVATCKNQSDPAGHAQNPDGDFSVDSFAFKVTPDSGMQTQEEEDTSLDTTDFPGPLTLHNQAGDSNDSHSEVDLDSRIFSDDSSCSKPEAISSQSTADRTSISSLGSMCRNSVSASAALNKRCKESNPPCLLNDNRTLHKADSLEEPLKQNDVTVSCADRTDFSNDALHEVSIKIETPDVPCLSEDKMHHASFGLNILVKSEDDKVECQARLGIVNGTSLPGQGL